MLDFPWGKRPATIPAVGTHGTATLYGGIGYRPVRVLEVSPRGSRIRIGFLDTTVHSSDRTISQDDGSLWVGYADEDLADRKIRGSIVLPWDGKRYYSIGLASIEFSSPKYFALS